MDIQTVLVCPDCGMVFDEEPENNEPEPLYECSCGETFTRSNSYSGDNHQCPQCMKFASKLADQACPDCAVELEEEEMVFDESAQEWVDEQTAADRQLTDEELEGADEA